MTGYVIWGSILLFFVILMVSPIVLSVKLGEENVIFVRYLFIKIPLFPAKEKDEEKVQKAKEKKEAKKLAKQKKEEDKTSDSEEQKKKAKMTVSEQKKSLTLFTTVQKSKITSSAKSIAMTASLTLKYLKVMPIS